VPIAIRLRNTRLRCARRTCWSTPQERAKAARVRALARGRRRAPNGALIEDAFLDRARTSRWSRSRWSIVGGYSPEFLELPEQVILAVAKGHQRYFGVRGGGRQAPAPLPRRGEHRAENPDNIRAGNDRVMRARLADARFFYREDLKIPLADRRAKLGGIVFQKRLGTVLGKAERIERLARELGLLLQLPEPTLMAAASGAHLAKCDLVSLMVGEFPELQGDMGHAYARAQGVSPEVAEVIREHYAPKGASDATAASDAGALVSIADRLDTLVGVLRHRPHPDGRRRPLRPPPRLPRRPPHPARSRLRSPPHRRSSRSPTGSSRTSASTCRCPS
jgi:glycyl-tRNA synthetase beta chain